jgi:hypothetical protein
MTIRERLSKIQIAIMVSLHKRGASLTPVTLATWQRRFTIHLWRRGLVRIFVEQTADSARRGPFYLLTIPGARLAQQFVHPAPRGFSGAERGTS